MRSLAFTAASCIPVPARNTVPSESQNQAQHFEGIPPLRFLSGSEGPPSRAAAAGTAIASGTMTSEEAKLAGFKADFENGLAQLESVLAKSGGPFFLG